MEERDIVRIVEAKFPYVRFIDDAGCERELDVSAWADMSDWWGKLKDPRYFSRAEICFEGGSIGWPDEQDIAPDDIAEFARVVGEPAA